MKFAVLRVKGHGAVMKVAVLAGGAGSGLAEETGETTCASL